MQLLRSPLEIYRDEYRNLLTSHRCQVVAVPDPRFSSDERTRVFRSEGNADEVLNSLWEFDGRPFGIDICMEEILKLQQPK